MKKILSLVIYLFVGLFATHVYAKSFFVTVIDSSGSMHRSAVLEHNPLNYHGTTETPLLPYDLYNNQTGKQSQRTVEVLNGRTVEVSFIYQIYDNKTGKYLATCSAKLRKNLTDRWHKPGYIYHRGPAEYCHFGAYDIHNNSFTIKIGNSKS
ncbi:MAG: hypothetical protein AAGG80_01355 [Pseudomonadota bacterium]